MADQNKPSPPPEAEHEASAADLDEHDCGDPHCGDAHVAQPFRRDAPKTGRNDPCPCGSGKKFKKCCQE